mgnify:CR=1 FL=1
MDNLREKFTYIIKKYFFQYILVPIIALIFIAQGWYSVWHQTNIIIERNILAYQQTELEILRTTARSVDQYITHEFEIHGRKEVSEFEQEIFDKFIEPIHLLENGDAWIYAPDYVVFDLSEDFPYEYFGKSMAEIFKVQKVNGASHYEEMTADIAEAREGVGWYIWLPEKGKEIAAWTPVWVGEYVWTIGLATPLSEILESNGAAEQIRALKMNKGIETLVLVIVFFMWLSSSIRQGRGEKALEKSEKRYRNLFDSAPDGVSILDANGTILECSQSTAELYGYARPEELYGKNMQELMSADSHKAFREKMPQLQNLNPSEGEIQISRPDGSVVDVWRKGIPLTGADGNFSGILSYDRDISKRKKAELKLRESEERFSSSFESSNIGMTMTGLDGRFLLVNKALSKMLGYTRAELKAKRLRDITHSEDAQKSLVYLRILLRNEINSFEDKKRYIRKDGSIFWVEIRVSAVRDEEGNLQYFFRHILDISERKRAEEKLRASEERQRTLLEATSSAGIFLFVVDDSYNVRYMNTPMIEAFGDLVGKTCHSAVNGGKSPCDYCQLSKVLQEGEQVHYQPTIADGRVFDIIALPYTDIEGTLCKLEIIQDITERVQSETELKKLYQAVEQSANSVVITDLDGSIEYVNPKFLKLTGYTEDEILGENPRVLKSGEHSKAFHKNLWETITSGEEWHGEFCNKKKDGSEQVMYKIRAALNK